MTSIERQADGVDRALHHVGEVDLARLQAEATADDRRDVEQVVDQLLLRVRVALDAGERGGHFLGVDLTLRQHARPAEHRIQRRPQFV